MICTPRRISRNRCLFPEHVNAGRVFSRADHETELAPPLISIKVGKSQEGGEQAGDPSECLQLKVQGKETDVNPLLLADCIQAEVQIGVHLWLPILSSENLTTRGPKMPETSLRVSIFDQVTKTT